MNLYRSKEWRTFRAELIRLEDGRCTRCLSTGPQTILHAHHKFYLPGRKPWDYSYQDCEILCQSCHAQEHGLIPPKSGWEFIGYDDLGSPDNHCEYCGTEIRHVFMIQHANWITLEVGEVCCDNLTATHIATDHMKGRRRLLDRKKRFASKWKVDTLGAYIRSGNIVVRIVTAGKAFKLCMNGKLGNRLFETPLDAKIRAFEVLESGEAARYLRVLQLKCPLAAKEITFRPWTRSYPQSF